MTKSYKEIKKEKEGTEVQIQDACWSGYKQVGMKKKGNRQVPNCVPESVVNALFGKDYIYEVQTENVSDMYKGTLTKAQLAKMKQTWATAKASDVTPSVKNFVKGLDQFTQMDIKGANIKYISDLIEEFEEGEVELVDNFKDIVEENEMRASVRRSEDLKEFSTAQIERLAKAYSVMKDRTISLSNAQKLGKMMDGVPDSSLNAIRKKKIPFLSGLALSKMIQKKIPVTESTYQDESAWEVSGVENEGREELQEVKVYRVSHPSKKTYEVEGDNEKEAIRRYKDEVGLKSDSGIRTLLIKDHGEELKEARWHIEGDLTYRGIRGGDAFEMVIDAPNEKAAEEKAEKELDKARAKRQIGPGGGGNIEDLDIHSVERTTSKLQAPYTYMPSEYNPELKEADLSKSQIKKVHKQADDLPKKDFMKRYGKDGDSVRYATATNMVKKKLGLGEDKQFIKKGELKMNDTYKQRLTSAMEHFNISSLGELNEDDHKTFFTYVDDMKEGLSAAQKKLPPALQKAIAAKMKDKKEVKEDLVGGQKKLDKDKDGDIDGKDFAKLRSMKKEYGMSGNMQASKKSTMSMPIKPASKMKEEKTKETDSEPKMKDLNAMVKDPHKSKEDKPMKDMNAGYMKSNVKAPVKDGGGADMAKVKDAPDMKDAMKKINAMYKEENKGNRYLQTKPGSLEEAVLKSRGLIKR